MKPARFAFAAIVSRQHDGRDFGVGLAAENDPGYWPQPGFGSFPTWTEASDKARRLNTIQPGAYRIRRRPDRCKFNAQDH